MTRDQVVDWLESIVFGGVAMTASALEYATDGQDITFTQWRAIFIIGEQEGGCRVGEVASFVHAALPTASRLLRRLEQRGLVSLERDEADRRATRASLTTDGARLRASVLGYRRQELEAIASAVRPSAASERVLRDLAAEFRERGRAQTGPRRRTSGGDPSR